MKRCSPVPAEEDAVVNVLADLGYPYGEDMIRMLLSPYFREKKESG